MEYWIDRLGQEILGPDNIRTMLNTTKLASYGFEAEDILKNRNRVFGIRMLAPGADESVGPALEVLCTLPDKYAARALALDLVSQIQNRYLADLADLDAQGGAYEDVSPIGAKFKTVHVASVDDLPVSHYRWQLMIGGAAMGMLLAVARWSVSEGEPAIAHS